MSGTYTTVQITCSSAWVDILIAELSGHGYDSFLETELGFETYCQAEAFDEASLQRVLAKYRAQTSIGYDLQVVEAQNWNETWEKNFEPIVVEDQCLVRATFHRAPRTYPYEVVINPKMSFGTGHHATTYLMLRQQLAVDHEHRRVMDVGCGTGILSIMAMKRGAAHVLAFDIDEWAVNNSRENFEINDYTTINLFQGTIAEVTDIAPFDLILANINRNVLLDEMTHYVSHLASGGLLLLSGFYEEDLPLMRKATVAQRLTELQTDSRAQWAVMVVQKK